MRKLFAALNIAALILLGIGVLNINRSIGLENSIYSLNAFIREKINQTQASESAGETTSLSQAAEAVVPIYVYEEVPIYRNQNNARLRFLQNFTTTVQVGSGTGFFISQDGYLLTNKHVVSNTSANYTVDLADGEVPVEVVYRDSDYDLAVVKITPASGLAGGNYPTITLADSSGVKMGQSVTGIGNAYGELNDSISSGEVSGLDRSALVLDRTGGIERMRGLIQTSARLYPGDSGGPLLDERGQAIGVNVASAIGEEVSFAIPINAAKQVLEKAGI